MMYPDALQGKRKRVEDGDKQNVEEGPNKVPKTEVTSESHPGDHQKKVTVPGQSSVPTTVHCELICNDLNEAHRK